MSSNREWRSKKLLYLYLGHPFFLSLPLFFVGPDCLVAFQLCLELRGLSLQQGLASLVLQLPREHLSIKSVCSLVIDSLSRRSMQRFPRRSVSLAPFCS